MEDFSKGKKISLVARRTRSRNIKSRDLPKGVYHVPASIKGNKRFKAVISAVFDPARPRKGVKIIGYYRTPEDAREAYKRAYIEFYGEWLENG